MVALVAALAGVVVFVANRGATPPAAADRTSARPAERTPATAEIATPPAAPARPAGARTIEVCGLGLVETDDTNVLPPQVLKVLDDAGPLQRAVAELGASGNPSDRAVALVFEARRAAQAVGIFGPTGRPPCEDNDMACLMALAETGRLSAQGYVQALAQLATQSGDPVAYALAYASCGGASSKGRAPGCEAITAERWTAIDPDNGVAWLRAAGAAAVSRDEAARVAALERAANAPRFDHLDTALLRPLASPSLARVTPLERFTVNLGANLAIVAIGSMPSQAASEYCVPVRGTPAANTPPSAERTALCDRLATALIERDASFLGHAVGVRIAERVGWPADRLDPLKREHEALYMTRRNAPPEVNDTLSCASIEAQTRRYTDTLHLGERAALRRARERSGKSVAQLSNEYQAINAELERRRAGQAR